MSESNENWQFILVAPHAKWTRWTTFRVRESLEQKDLSGTGQVYEQNRRKVVIKWLHSKKEWGATVDLSNSLTEAPTACVALFKSNVDVRVVIAPVRKVFVRAFMAIKRRPIFKTSGVLPSLKSKNTLLNLDCNFIGNACPANYRRKILFTG